MSIIRILVTGARDWSDEQAVADALAETYRRYRCCSGLQLVHGAAAGVDTTADEVWAWMAEHGGDVLPAERHPASDFPSPRARNQHMVDRGAFLCLAFALRWDSGTGMCARMARRAGIPVVDFGVPTGSRGAS